MKKIGLAFSLALTLSLSTPLSFAEDSKDASEPGNSDVGKGKAAACASCHGEDGNSLVANFPKLAQQNPLYLVRQLQNFKSGERKDPVMSPMAMPLSEGDMHDIAAYYTEQKISVNPAPTLPENDDDEAGKTPNQEPVTMASLLNKGSNLYRNGDLAREVSACIACHGPSGEGNKPAGFPALRSQHADYLIKALTDFKSGARSNNPDNMMHMIAKKMTDEEIKAVAYHISTMQ